MKQLPLAMRLRDDTTFSNFFASEANQTTYQALQAIAQPDNNSTPFIYIWGPPHSGRTHLLQATCQQVQQGGDSVMYLPFAQCEQLAPAWLEDLASAALICIDDIEQIAGKPDWEEAVFHLYNQLQAAQARLVVAANAPPAQLGIQLPDLTSRLTAGAVFALQPLTDDEKLQALQQHAQARGMALPDAVGSFLLRRVSRDMATLSGVLEQLDNASLAAKRKLTVPLVKEVLAL